MKTINPEDISVPELHQYLVSTVAPRPIAFVSTLDENGTPNIAPYSFFNVFSANPPILVFSSNRRPKDNGLKDTYHNIVHKREVVINLVSHEIVRQMALASIAYPQGVSEFQKAGLTPLESELVAPFRIQESPVQMECKVEDIIPLGEKGGAGNLFLCRVVRLHIDEAVFNDENKIDPHRLDLMGRMGRAFYVRASGEAIHQIFQPFDQLGMGFDGLPDSVRHSSILTGNELAKIAALVTPPTKEEITAVRDDHQVQKALASQQSVEALHLIARRELEKEAVQKAAQILWLAEQLNAEG